VLYERWGNKAWFAYALSDLNRRSIHSTMMARQLEAAIRKELLGNGLIVVIHHCASDRRRKCASLSIDRIRHLSRAQYFHLLQYLGLLESPQSYRFKVALCSTTNHVIAESLFPAFFQNQSRYAMLQRPVLVL